MKGDNDLKITPKMIEAGCAEAREYRLGWPLDELVRGIYIAMAIEAQTSVSASATSDPK